MTEYEAVVIGSGPGGVSTVAALLDTGVKRILWVDREFTGGRLNTMYREISSNTKTGIYLDAIHSSPSCIKIINSTPRPNAITKLEQIDRDETCDLALAGDMVMMLIEGLGGFEGVEKCLGDVEALDLADEVWTVSLSSGRKATASQIHLSTGSHPTILSLHETHNPHLTILDLDQTMILSSLPSLLPRDKSSTVGIIGNSHSGILATMNFYQVATSPDGEVRRDVKVVNYQRREILFADYREDGIVWDNSGLKGKTADWAREHMLNNNDDSDSEKGIVQQIRLDKIGKSEEEVYREYLPKCTHLVYAVGYQRNPLPRITIDGEVVKDENLEFDMHTSGFYRSIATTDATDTNTKTARRVMATGKKRESEGGRPRAHGLYGTGIAFPEETEDPEGHVEAAVGLAKFFKFAERVKGDWGKVC